MTVSALTLSEAARMMREAMRDRSYELTPLGQETVTYLRTKRKRLTKDSAYAYESTLAAFALQFWGLEIKDFEPPVGTTRLEEWLDANWGRKRPATYNRHLSVLRDFFRFQVMRSRMVGDPTLVIERAKKRDVYRTVFSEDQARGIIAAQEELRDRVAVRLLLNYGLRKGGLRAVQFKHFDHVRKRLTVFLKGGKIRHLPLPEPAFWHDLERLILDCQAEPGHYLMCGARGNRYGSRKMPDTPMSGHALHDWWYRCLANAGVVPEGTTSGERMHKARHTAGQRLLDKTGNLKSVQRLLGHESIATTGDVYVDFDEAQLAVALAKVLEEEP